MAKNQHTDRVDVTHAVLDMTSPITIGEEIRTPSMKVTNAMQFLALPPEQRCQRCDWTKAPKKDRK